MSFSLKGMIDIRQAELDDRHSQAGAWEQERVLNVDGKRAQ